MVRNGVSKEIQAYLAREDTPHPLFIAFDSADDLQAIQQELGTSATTMRISNFCAANDAFPNLDLFFAELNKSQTPRLLLLGCGEYAELAEDSHFLSKLFGIQCHSKQKIIIPIWNGFAFLEAKRQDPRIDDTRVLSYPQTQQIWRLSPLPKQVELNAVCGFKNILSLLEKGGNGKITIKTSCPLNPKWCEKNVSVFDLYYSIHPSAHLSPSLFTDKEWERFLDDNRIQDKQLYSADSFLKLKSNPPDDESYIQIVLDRTNAFSAFRHNLATSIFEISPSAPNYTQLYAEWKKIMEKLPTDDVQAYLSEVKRFDGEERLAYLSDNTLPEKLEILSVVTNAKKVPKALSRVYPQLNLYTQPYTFSIPNDTDELAKTLTEYFEAYKKQKLFNELTPSFQEKMKQMAYERPYNMLPSRGAILEKLKKEHVHLYWLDALGCEFLGFIQQKAAELGLNVTIQVARAKLPTLTSINRDFYEEWNKGTKDQSKNLDELKHGNFNTYNYNRFQMPVELVYELQVLEQLLKDISVHLKSKKSQKVVLTSDHGATRLAIISGNETTWQFSEKGKHGGRCCRASEYDGETLPFVAHDDDEEWNVLANYDKFKGGRKSDVEVHGGATLEEVVVPIIEFELPNAKLNVELLTKEIKVSFRDTSIKLVLFCTQKLEKLSIKFSDKRYDCNEATGNPLKHEVELPKPKCGNYSISVYEGDKPLGTLEFSVQNAGIGIKKDNFF